MTTEQGASVGRGGKKPAKVRSAHDAPAPASDAVPAPEGAVPTDPPRKAPKSAATSRKSSGKDARTTEPTSQPGTEPSGAPRTEAGPGPMATPEAQPGGGGGSRRRVVIAEDEPLIRLDLAEMLTEAGYDVVGQAPDGKVAVALTRELRPDLVLLDVKMPVLDGISAAEQIGAESLAPVVMLTAFSQRELVERASEAGVMAYVVKPFTIADLTPAIEVAASRWQQMRALEVEIADLADRLETRKLVDRAKGLLMSQLKLSEPEAFRWVQKTAMDRRLSMREVAELVIEGIPGKKG
jgi:response regulator NasT